MQAEMQEGEPGAPDRPGRAAVERLAGPGGLRGKGLEGWWGRVVGVPERQLGAVPLLLVPQEVGGWAV